ncbi:hypothetical protein Ancab_018249 [Ancistrocladus abbreviatus]
MLITWRGSTIFNACNLSKPQVAATSWDKRLLKLHAKGVKWKHLEYESARCNVEADGNCLFTASQKAMASELKEVKLLAKKADRGGLDSTVVGLINLGMQR